MSATPQAAKVLSNALAAHSWQQLDLAKAASLDRATVSLHLNGTRAIRDDHLALYCTALDRIEQSQLVAAWLRDTLPADAQEAVLSHDTNRLREEVQLWKPGLDPEQQSMIQWWTERLALDRDLDEIFRIITRRCYGLDYASAADDCPNNELCRTQGGVSSASDATMPP